MGELRYNPNFLTSTLDGGEYGLEYTALGQSSAVGPCGYNNYLSVSVAKQLLCGPSDLQSVSGIRFYSSPWEHIPPASRWIMSLDLYFGYTLLGGAMQLHSEISFPLLKRSMLYKNNKSDARQHDVSCLQTQLDIPSHPISKEFSTSYFLKCVCVHCVLRRGLEKELRV
jgi:hypothetical protein